MRWAVRVILATTSPSAFALRHDRGAAPGEGSHRARTATVPHGAGAILKCARPSSRTTRGTRTSASRPIFPTWTSRLGPGSAADAGVVKSMVQGSKWATSAVPCAQVGDVAALAPHREVLRQRAEDHDRVVEDASARELPLDLLAEAKVMVKGIRRHRAHVVLEVGLRGGRGPLPELEQVDGRASGEGVLRDAAMGRRVGRAQVQERRHERDLGADAVVGRQLRAAERDGEQLPADLDRCHQPRDGVGAERREANVQRVGETEPEGRGGEERKRGDAPCSRREALHGQHGDRQRDAERDEALGEGLPAGDLERRQHAGEEQEHGSDPQAAVGGVRIGTAGSNGGHDGRGGDAEQDDQRADERTGGDGPREHRERVAPSEAVEALGKLHAREATGDDQARGQDGHGGEPRERDATELGETPRARRPRQGQRDERAAREHGTEDVGDGVDEQEQRDEGAPLPRGLPQPQRDREGEEADGRGHDEGPEPHVECPRERQREARQPERPARAGKPPDERDEGPRDEQDQDAQRGLQAVAPAQPRLEGPGDRAEAARGELGRGDEDVPVLVPGST